MRIYHIPFIHLSHRALYTYVSPYKKLSDATDRIITNTLPPNLHLTVKRVWYVFDIYLPFMIATAAFTYISFSSGLINLVAVKMAFVSEFAFFSEKILGHLDLYTFDILQKIPKRKMWATSSQENCYEEIDAQYKKGVRKLIITGAAGSGKTELIKGISQRKEWEGFSIFDFNLEKLLADSHGDSKALITFLELLFTKKTIVFIDQFQKLVDTSFYNIPLAWYIEKLNLKDLLIVGVVSDRNFAEKIEKSQYTKGKYVRIPLEEASFLDLKTIAFKRFSKIDPAIVKYAYQNLSTVTPSKMIDLFENISVVKKKKAAYFTKEDVDQELEKREKNEVLPREKDRHAFLREIKKVSEALSC